MVVCVVFQGPVNVTYRLTIKPKAEAQESLDRKYTCLSDLNYQSYSTKTGQANEKQMNRLWQLSTQLIKAGIGFKRFHDLCDTGPVLHQPSHLAKVAIFQLAR